MEVSSAGFRKAFCNGEAKPAAAVRPAFISANKPFREILSLLQFFLRGILDSHLRLTIYFFQRQKNTGALQGIFQRVLNQIGKHPVHPLAVRKDHDFLLRKINPQLKAGLFYGILPVRQRLAQKLSQIQPFHFQRKLPGSRPADFKHVLDNFPKTLRFCGQDFHIIPQLLRELLRLL